MLDKDRLEQLTTMYQQKYGQYPDVDDSVASAKQAIQHFIDSVIKSSEANLHDILVEASRDTFNAHDFISDPDDFATILFLEYIAVAVRLLAQIINEKVRER